MSCSKNTMVDVKSTRLIYRIRREVKRCIKNLRIKRQLNQCNNSIFLASGMPRSGSTKLFNIVRLCLEQKYKGEVLVCWEDELGDLDGENYSCVLVKSHYPPKALIDRSKVIFYSYRDIRFSVVSSFKKFGGRITWASFDSIINEYDQALQYATKIFSYEDITLNQEFVIQEVLSALNIELLDQEIQAITEAIPSPSKVGGAVDSITKMHGGHATGVDLKDVHCVLGDFDLDVYGISTRYRKWFLRTGYPLYLENKERNED